MRTRIVTLPQSSQTVLAPNIPELEVYRRIWGREGECYGVLADGGDGFQVWVRGCVGRFYLLEERGFACVVEAEEEDGVL